MVRRNYVVITYKKCTPNYENICTLIFAYIYRARRTHTPHTHTHTYADTYMLVYKEEYIMHKFCYSS